jgi:hypothetical protein
MMTRAWIVVVTLGALAGVARADAVQERWVGSWTGKVTAKGCADAPKRVTLDVAVTTSGGLRSSGDVLLDGIGDVDWARTKQGLSASTGAFTASLTGKASAKLAFKTRGGCSIKATLTRRTSKIPSCDRVLALATIKSQCASDGTDLAEVEAALAGWTKLKGKAKTAQKQACETRAATLEAEVAACGQGSLASGFPTTGIQACDELFERSLRCIDKMGASSQQIRDAFLESAQAYRDMASNADVRKVAEDTCRQAVDAARAGWEAAGC